MSSTICIQCFSLAWIRFAECGKKRNNWNALSDDQEKLNSVDVCVDVQCAGKKTKKIKWNVHYECAVDQRRNEFMENWKNTRYHCKCQTKRIHLFWLLVYVCVYVWSRLHIVSERERESKREREWEREILWLFFATDTFCSFDEDSHGFSNPHLHCLLHYGLNTVRAYNE